MPLSQSPKENWEPIISFLPLQLTQSSVNLKADLSGETEFAPDLGWGQMRLPQAWPSPSALSLAPVLALPRG